MARPWWGEGEELSQVICGCGGEGFKLIISPVAIRMVCAQCGRLNADVTRPMEWEPGMTMGEVPADLDELPRTTMDPGMAQGPPTVNAAWVGGDRDQLVPPEPETVTWKMPAEASDEAANAVMSGGRMHGRKFAFPPGLDTFYVAPEHHGYYQLSGTIEGRLRLYVWTPTGDGPQVLGCHHGAR